MVGAPSRFAPAPKGRRPPWDGPAAVTTATLRATALSYAAPRTTPLRSGGAAGFNGSILQLAHSAAMNPISFPTPAVAAKTVRMSIDCELQYELDAACEFVFLIHAAQGMGQYVVDESLLLEPATAYRSFVEPGVANRFLRLHAAPGSLRLRYQATVDRVIDAPDANAIEVPVFDLPDHTLPYLLPTRYCESDHLANAAIKMFGALAPGYARVQAVSDWVRNNVDYRIGSTNATTTAREVFVQRTGVCRDFAHLAVTLCRALNIPARLVCGYAKFDEPPPDFHAVFEAWLGGRWVLFDPTGMAPLHHLVRVATGRDAKDVAFATIFGPARMVSMRPDIEPVLATPVDDAAWPVERASERIAVTA